MWYFMIGVSVLLAGSAVAWALATYGRGRPSKDLESKARIALAALNRKIQDGTADVSVYTKRGIIRYRRGDLRGALADLDRAVRMDNTCTEAHYHRGIVRRQLGDLTGAEQDFCWIRDYSEDPFYRTVVTQQLPGLRAMKAGRSRGAGPLRPGRRR